ncbi:hypothetical protein TNCV_1196821 [Trichonephila clavipes]|uniref:Uncharacterized protein n=1 Tax=Trichonephila clavipes TaxID=2585209 RepID=A0A8X6RXV6_TRICX|nr:hypothetical protein TNCV_1196821 [Trichonephila clavipes]
MPTGKKANDFIQESENTENKTPMFICKGPSCIIALGTTRYDGTIDAMFSRFMNQYLPTFTYYTLVTTSL